MTARGTAAEGAGDGTRLRQGCYRLFSRGFFPPGEQAVADLLGGGMVLDTMDVDAFAFAPSLWDWLERLEAADPDLLASEYVRLFESGTDGSLCSLVESIRIGSVRAGDGAVASARIADAMRRHGVDAEARGVPPDHLTVQLELGSVLCDAEAKARTGGDVEALSAVLAEEAEAISQLAGWLPALADDVASHDRSGAYAALSAAVAAFVVHDADLIRMITGVS